MSKQLTKICLQCKKEFRKPYNESFKAWIERHKYCSRTCYVESMKGKYPFGDYKPTGEKLRGRKFIERTGENNPNWKGGKVILNCKYCGKEFIVEGYRKDIAKYCSHKCHNATRNLTPENGKLRRIKKYKDWRIAVFKRDNYTCQKCGIRSRKGLGKTVNLNADHIKPFAYFKELRFEVSNGITLCEDCHRKTDTYGVNSWRIYKNCVYAESEA